MIRIAIAFISISLSACVTEYRYPISGELSDGTPLSGLAVARTNGRATVNVVQPGVAKCSGEYDALSKERVITVPFTCTDGRTGEAVTTRNEDLSAGTTIARFSDGETATLRFDDSAIR